MVFQVSSNCRMFMLANALVQVLGCVPDIICVAQIILHVDRYYTVVSLPFKDQKSANSVKREMQNLSAKIAVLYSAANDPRPQMSPDRK